MPSQDGTYSQNGSTIYPSNNKDTGTNHYSINSYSAGISQTIIRESNQWKHYVTVSGSGSFLTYTLHLPSTSNENDPPCAGIWERYNPQNPGGSTGEYHYVTMTGNSCSTFNNPPPTLPSQAFTMTPSNIQLARYFDTDIPTIPTPQAGMMIWDITNSCVKVYNGTTWNCL